MAKTLWCGCAVTRRSGIGAAVVAAVLLPWTFTFMIGGSNLCRRALLSDRLLTERCEAVWPRMQW